MDNDLFSKIDINIMTCILSFLHFVRAWKLVRAVSHRLQFDSRMHPIFLHGKIRNAVEMRNLSLFPHVCSLHIDMIGDGWKNQNSTQFEKTFCELFKLKSLQCVTVHRMIVAPKSSVQCKQLILHLSSIVKYTTKKWLPKHVQTAGYITNSSCKIASSGKLVYSYMISTNKQN